MSADGSSGRNGHVDGLAAGGPYTASPSPDGRLNKMGMGIDLAARETRGDSIQETRLMLVLLLLLLLLLLLALVWLFTSSS